MVNMTLVLSALGLILLALFLVFFVRGVNKKKDEEEVKEVISILSNDNTKLNFATLGFENYLIEKLAVPRSKTRIFVYAIRTIIVCAVIALYFAIGVFALAIGASALILVFMNGKKNEAVERSGVTRIQDTVSFMDYFSPQIASGSSASQAFVSYIQKLDDDDPYKDLLVEYFDKKRNEDYSYETPDKIKDIVSVYEIALYNEDMGSDNYLYIIEEAKADLFQKSKYYADYCSKVGEVLKPIETAYYVGVPAIIIMLLGTVGDFWFTIWGWIVAILLVVLFFTFKYLCNQLAINSMHEIL